MGDTPTVGDVKVTLKLDTEEAKKKVAEVERKLRNNERERRTVIERVNKDGFGAKSGGGKMGQTIADKLLEKVLPKSGGYNPTAQLNAIGRFVGASSRGVGPGAQQFQTANQAGVAALRAVAGRLNPFPSGGVSGEEVGVVAPTLALAAALYTGLNKASKFAGLGIAYAMKSGEASVKTPAGQFFNELNSTFSYINNYAGSYKDAGQRLAAWDDAVAAVTGKLPDQQFYFPKFQRQAAFEREFSDMMSRNQALTRAGASGNSSIEDQLGNFAAQSMSR